ncbi:MAG TPA: TPM domain-containing protein, partial [Vicinamibacteria bacterium]|nr:TPM domain-containing protein [Vicinamibacteria bacterium]
MAALLAVAVPPRPERYATDRAGVADPARLAALNERLAQFERETSTQVLVYVDRRLPPGTSMEEFAAAAFKEWKVGRADKDNGVVFFAFVDDRQMRIEVGYGLEGALPDARAARILEDHVRPRFRAGDIGGGAEAAAAEILRAARHEPYQGSGRTVAEGGTPAGPLPWWLWGIPVVGMGAAGLMARGDRTPSERMIRGGVTLAFVTGFLSFAATPLLNDARPLALGFGVLLLAAAAALPVAIGSGASVKGRRRLGLGMVQAAAGLMIGGFGLVLLGVAWGPLLGLGGLAFLLGILMLPLGGLVFAKEPWRVLTLFFGRLAFVVLLLSAPVFGFLRYQGVPAARVALDFLVVSGVVWFVLWIVARSRAWPLLEMTVLPRGGGGWSYSSGGSSGWSSSGS